MSKTRKNTVIEPINFLQRLKTLGITEDEVPAIFKSSISFETINDPLVMDHIPEHIIDKDEISQMKFNIDKPQNEWRNPFSDEIIIPLEKINQPAQQKQLDRLLKEKKILEEKLKATEEKTKAIQQQLDRIKLNKEIIEYMSVFVGYLEEIYFLKKGIKAKKLLLEQKHAIKQQINEATEKKQYLRLVRLTHFDLPKLHFPSKKELLDLQLKLSDLLHDFMNFALELDKKYPDHPLKEKDELAKVLKKSITMYRKLEKDLKNYQSKLLLKDAYLIFNELKTSKIDDEVFVLDAEASETQKWLSTLKPSHLKTVEEDVNKRLQIRELKVNPDSNSADKIQDDEVKVKNDVGFQVDKQVNNQSYSTSLILSSRSQLLLRNSANYNQIFFPATAPSTVKTDTKDLDKELDIEERKTFNSPKMS